MALANLLRVCSFVMLANLTACHRYAVSINEKVVYEPPKLFTDFVISDAELNSCIRSTIAENRLTKAEQLTRLICAPGNIRNLMGIEVFTNIEYLGLRENQIENITILEKLSQLKQLDIAKNNVQKFNVLSTLESLVFLNSEGNAKADCESLRFQKQGLKKILPEHCRSESS